VLKHLPSSCHCEGVARGNPFFPFETPAQDKSIVIRFVLSLRNKKALIPVKYYGDIKAFEFILSYMCHIA